MIVPSRDLVGTHSRETRPHRLPLPDDADSYSNGIDWHAVHRAINGEHPRAELTRDELREAALWLSKAGTPRKAISIQLCVYERLVKEWEAEEGLLPERDLCTRPGCRRAHSGRGLCAACLNQQRSLDREWQAAVSDLAVAA